MTSAKAKDLIERMLSGDRKALARCITKIESNDPDKNEILEEIYPRTGSAYIIGFTGPPGAGKSTIVDRIAQEARASNRTIGIIAIDPSSPFSGGALLGDRIRMNRHAMDKGVFIRSLGSRGHQGGLSRSTREVVHIMDAFGFELVIIETVGVGQTELDIMEVAHTTVVVFTPESGDTIQTMKAGLTEIADIFIVNKCDREGADKMARELESMLSLRDPADWSIPVLMTNALDGNGIDRLFNMIFSHFEYLERSGRMVASRSKRLAEEFTQVLVSRVADSIKQGILTHDALFKLAAQVSKGRLNPYAAARLALCDPGIISLILNEGGCS